MGYVIAVVAGLVVAGFLALLPFLVVLYGVERVLRLLPFVAAKFPVMMLKNLRRNLVRTALTFVATFVLVQIITLVWSLLYYVQQWTTEKAKNPKVIVTEKWQADSHMPFRYAANLCEGAANPVRAEDIRPSDSMTWQFYLGTLDPAKKTRDSFIFCIAVEPRKVLTMWDEIWDELAPQASHGRGGATPEDVEKLRAAIHEMEHDKRAVIIGRNQLKTINKQVGETFTLTGVNYTDINLEFRIIAELPPGARYNDNTFMNRDYLNDALNEYPRKHGGKHPMADRSLDLVWLKVPDQAAFGRVAQQIESSGLFRDPAVKCSTLSAEITSVMEAYRSLIWGLRWLLSPSILVCMTVIIATGISLSVRERRTEIAVLKVLGFRPGQVLLLVLGEAVLIGTVSGFISAGLTCLAVNEVLDRLAPQIFLIPVEALWWGPALGGMTSLVGSVFPAWQACRIQVSEVFARVA
ncbi:MAG TPA: ABC transporter permease [Gemmataceae bacterium]|jgi:putative ABC transport system permease protein|nr:ABC transporter permease [Gemmataceae bacterium]